MGGERLITTIEAAKKLGISRPTLYKHLHRLGAERLPPKRYGRYLIPEWVVLEIGERRGEGVRGGSVQSVLSDLPLPCKGSPAKWYSVAGSAAGRAVMEGARSVQGVGARAPSSGRARAAIRELPGGTHTPLEGLCRANSVRTTAVQKGPKGRFSAPCEQPDQAEKPAQRALSRFPLPSAGASPPRRGSRTDRASAARESRARSQRTTRAARPSPRGGYSRRPL
jgi:hypothetical protein